jgi:Rieske Fe-S protein
LVTACGSGGSEGGSSAAAAGTGTVLAKAADIPSDGSLVVTVDKAPYALAKKADGTITVHTGICTHMQCTVQAAGAKLHCNCHGSEFDAFTGEVLQSPAPSPLAQVSFQEKDGNVVLS